MKNTEVTFTELSMMISSQSSFDALLDMISDMDLEVVAVENV